MKPQNENKVENKTKQILNLDYIEIPGKMKIIWRQEVKNNIVDDQTLVLCIDTSGSMCNVMKAYIQKLFNICINMGFTAESQIILVTFASCVECLRCPLKKILDIEADGNTNFSPVFTYLAEIFKQNEHVVILVITDGKIGDSSSVPEKARMYQEIIKKKNIQFDFVGIISYGLRGTSICEKLCPGNIFIPWRRTEDIPGQYLNELPNFRNIKIMDLSPMKFIILGYENSTILSFNIAGYSITVDNVESFENTQYQVIFTEINVSLNVLGEITKKLVNTVMQHLIMLQRKGSNVLKIGNETYSQILQNILCASESLAEKHINISTDSDISSKIKSGRFGSYFSKIKTIDDSFTFEVLNKIIIEFIKSLDREKQINKQQSRTIMKTDEELNLEIREKSLIQAATAAKLERRQEKKLGPIVEVTKNELHRLEKLLEKEDTPEGLTSVISLKSQKDSWKEYMKDIDLSLFSQLSEESANMIGRYFPLNGFDCDMVSLSMVDTTQINMKKVSSDNTILSTEDKYCQSGRDAKLPSGNTGTHQIFPIFNPTVFEYLVKNCPRLLQQSFLLNLFGSNIVESTLHISDPLVGIYGAGVFYFCIELCKTNSTILWEKLKIGMEHLFISGIHRYKNVFLHLKENINSQLKIESWTFTINDIVFHLINDHIGIPQFLLHLQLAFNENQFVDSNLVKKLRMICIMIDMKRWVKHNTTTQYTDNFLELLGYDKSIFVYPPQLFLRPQLMKPTVIPLQDIDINKLNNILSEQFVRIQMIAQLPTIIENLHKNNHSFVKNQDCCELIPLVLYCLAQGIKNFQQIENNINPEDPSYVTQYLEIFITETFTNDKIKWESERNKEETIYMHKNIVPMMMHPETDDNMFIEIAKFGLKRKIIDTDEVVIYKLPDGGPFHDAVIKLIKKHKFARAYALLIGYMTVNDVKHIIYSKPRRIDKNMKKEYISLLDSIDSMDSMKSSSDSIFNELCTFIRNSNEGFNYRESNVPNRHYHCKNKPSFASLGYSTQNEYGLALLKADKINEFIKYIKDHNTCECKCNDSFNVHMLNTSRKDEDLATFLDRMKDNHDWWVEILEPTRPESNININEYNFAKFHSWLLKRKVSQADYNTILDDWLEKNSLKTKRKELLKKYPKYITNVRKISIYNLN
jgi:hypothetical protein